RIHQRQRSEIERMVRRDPGREQCPDDHHDRDRRCADGDRVRAEAEPEVAVEEAAQRPGGRLAQSAESITTHLNWLKLSANCTSETFLRVPQASACWCSGRWPTSS